MDRDEAIIAADEIIAGLNDEVTGMDPEMFKLWHPTESERPGLSKLDGSKAIMERIPGQIQSVVDDIRKIYNSVSGSSDSTLAHGAQVVQRELDDLESFANEVIPQAATTFEGAAETANSTYQFIRDANAQSRTTIANSQAGNGGFFSFLNPVVGGAGEVLNDDSMLTTNADEIEQSVTTLEEQSTEFQRVIERWMPGDRLGGNPDSRVPEWTPPGPEDGPKQATPDTGGDTAIPRYRHPMGTNEGDTGGGSAGGSTGPNISDVGDDSGDSSLDTDAPGTGADIPTPDLGMDTPELGDSGLGGDMGGLDDTGGLDLPEYGMGGDDSSFMSPDVPEPQLGGDSLGLDTGAGADSGWSPPETSLGSDDVGTQTSGWTPPEEDEEDVDALFDDLDEDGDDNAFTPPEGAGGEGPEVDADSEGRDIDGGDPQGTDEDEESGSGVFDDNLDGPGSDADLPEGGASGVDDPELGQASTDGHDGQWEPPAAMTGEGEDADAEEVTAEVAGEQIAFPNEATAELAENMEGDNPMPLREAASDAGFEVPGEGEDIGAAIDPIDAQPGDVLVSEDGDYLYLGDERALGPDGEVREFEDGVFPAFGDAHQGFFRMDAGDGVEGLEPTAGSTAPGEPEMAQASTGGDGEPSEADEPVERREDAPVGLGAGQFSPETATETTGHAEGDGDVAEPSLEAEDPEDSDGEADTGGEADTTDSDTDEETSSHDDDALGISDGEDDTGVSDDGPSDFLIGDGSDDSDDGDDAGQVAGSTGSNTAGGSVSEPDEPLDPNQVAP